jgi:hypothetical protein
LYLPNGGAGAGGLLQGSVPVTAGTSYTVTVGGGGAATTGSNSVFGSISASGGGLSGGSGGVPTAGGSGGGGTNLNLGAQGIAGQGNAGGKSSGNGEGGGGGAGTVGLDAPTATGGGNGGAGIASAISGTVTAYAGGGGGSGNGSGAFAGSGGAGGGGNAAVYPTAGANGTANTGGGGGGGQQSTGGSGIVIVSYPDIYAAAASTTGSPTVSTSGSGSLSFNGSNQAFRYAGQSGFAYGTGDFTIEFWMYPNTFSASYRTIYESRDVSNTGNGPLIYFHPSGGLLVYLNGADRISGAVVTAGQWSHIAVCRISGSTKAYINGTQTGSTYSDSTNYTIGSNVPVIGANYTGNAAIFDGYVSNLRVVKGVGVYTGTFTPSTSPLQATQPAGTNIAAITGTSTSLLLNSVSGAYLADGSTNAYPAALSTSPTVVPVWNQASPFSTGLGYKNRVYTYTGSGTITF